MLNPTASTTAAAEADQAKTTNKFYLATWRWHFYAGIYVIPFILMLSLTGLIMVLHDQIEAVQYGDRLFVTPSNETVTAEAQVEAVRKAYSGATISQFILPTAVDRSSQVSITISSEGDHVEHEGDVSLTVFVNPYTGEVLGDLDPSTTWNTWANNVHGTFFLNETGDYLIEIAAGLAILLVITGLYLWWPRRGQSLKDVFIPRFGKGKRLTWRDLHASIGFWLAPIILFFMISGLAWTAIWGGKLTQAWSTFPAEKWDNIPLSDQTHASLNRGVLEEVPWALEQTPLPASGSLTGKPGIPAGFPVNLDTVIAYARDNGFTTFRVNLPADETGVWTVSADTMSGDITDPRQDRTLHLDQYTGNVLADVKFTDYSLMGKGMAAGIALHQGDAGMLNLLFNVLFCLAMIFIAVSSVVMWWLRRPKGIFRLAAPPMPKNLPLWKGAVFIMLLVSLAFPLTGITLLTILALDLFIFSQIPFLRSVLN